MADYIDNKKFLEELIKYREHVKYCELNNKEKPVVPRYIGECFIDIASRLIRRVNFVNYSYRDDMVSDGIENSLLYMGNFDPEKSSNPFSYFTQIIYFAYLRRIIKEKKQTYLQEKYISRIDTDLYSNENMTFEERNEFNSLYLGRPAEMEHLKRNTLKEVKTIRKAKQRDYNPLFGSEEDYDEVVLFGLDGHIS